MQLYICQELQRREAMSNELANVQSETAALGWVFLRSGCIVSLQMSYLGVLTSFPHSSSLDFKHSFIKVNYLPVLQS